MAPIRIIHIAPELPPTVGGVADYTYILSRRLDEVSQGAVESVLVHAGNKEADVINVDMPVTNLSGQRSEAALAATIERLASEAEGQTIVLLEYSGYGYANRGAPLWLLRSLRRVRRNGGIPLITIFHELFATSYKPWDRRFWTMPVQYYVASRLARLSDGCMANWDAAAQWVQGQVNGTPVRMSPTFSNVGEPEHVPDYAEREPYAVCFGGAGQKEEMYRHHGDALSDVLRHYEIERVVDLGPEPAEEVYAGMEVPVNPKGIQPEEEISGQLKRASLGLLNYPLHCLKKSGVWASYAAHGVPSILTAESGESEGLVEGRHFLILGGALSSWNHRYDISTKVRKWYFDRAHSNRAACRLINEAKYAARKAGKAKIRT